MRVYAVRNAEGKWLRSKGYGGVGESWVGDLEHAKLWLRLSAARGRVGFFALNYPEYGVPEVVEFDLVETRVLNEAERVKTARLRVERREARQEAARKEFERAKEMARRAGVSTW